VKQQSLEVETEGIDLHYSNIGSTNGDNDYGDEAALVGSDNAENLTTGDGDDSVIIDNDIESNVTIDLGAGDDVIEVGDDFDSGYINSGKGDDTVIIHDDLGDNYTGETGHISTGAGDDSVTVGKLKDDSTITTGSGDDNVVLEEVSSSFDNGSVSLGSGDDILEINDDLEGTDGMFYGGAGNDTLVLKDVTQEEWEAGIKDHFEGFENTVLQDTTLIDEGSTNTTYEVDDNGVMLIEGDETIDFSLLDENNSTSIDTLILGEGTQNMVKLSLEDVVELTDESNILRIEGDVTDKITLNMTDGNGHGHGHGNHHGADGEENGWKLGDFKTDAETGATYQEVTGKVDDQTVRLEINTDIQIDQQ